VAWLEPTVAFRPRIRRIDQVLVEGPGIPC
jgi:hypothetical protein